MTLAITLSLWLAEHISQARCLAAGPRARAEPPRAQPGADGGSRQPGTGTRPGRRMRAGREAAGGIRLWGEGEMPGEKPKRTLLLPALRGAPCDASQGPLVAMVSGGGLLFPWTPLQGSCPVGTWGQVHRPQPARPCLSAHAKDPRCLRDARRPASRTPPHSSGTWSRGPGKARSLFAPITLFK